jgi:DNA invertase Pin-like site-specific DNA recombinase
MIAAIYARKSKKRPGEDAESESESVETQVIGARAFIAAQRGWTLDESNIYKDDGRSGALFASREEFQRMMRDAEAGAFGAIVFFDLDRFGRNAQKSMEALNALAEFGVEVYDYSTGTAVDLESFEGETMTFLKTRFAQQYFAQIRKHTKAAMRRKAAMGHATGNRIFGYENFPVVVGDEVHHRELRIVEEEANIIRDIYARCAAGQGARTIAAALNRKGVPKPRAQQGRADGWSVSTVRAVLRRPLYRGEIVYGRTAKAYGRELRKVYRGTKREKGQIPKPEKTWTRCDLPDVADRVRIIDPDLAARVDARLDDRRERYIASRIRNDGRAPEKAHGKYLLSGGMLICPTCGGHFEARKNPWKPRRKTEALLPPNARVGHPGHVYICSTRRRKPGVCINTLALPIDETDDTVLSIIEGEVLNRTYVRELLSLVESAPDETDLLLAQRAKLQGEVDNLVDSIAKGIPADTVASAINDRQSAIRKLDAQLRTPKVTRTDRERLKAALEQRAKDWKRELRAEPRIARLVLRRLVGPIVLHDESERPAFVKWEAQPTVGLLDGLAPPIWLASRVGFEPTSSTLKGLRDRPLH